MENQTYTFKKISLMEQGRAFEKALLYSSLMTWYENRKIYEIAEFPISSKTEFPIIDCQNWKKEIIITLYNYILYNNEFFKTAGYRTIYNLNGIRFTDKLIFSSLEDILNFCVCELYFEKYCNEQNKKVLVYLKDLKNIKDINMDYLRNLINTIYARDSDVMRAVFFQDTIPGFREIVLCSNDLKRKQSYRKNSFNMSNDENGIWYGKNLNKAVYVSAYEALKEYPNLPIDLEVENFYYQPQRNKAKDLLCELLDKNPKYSMCNQ